MQKRLACPDAVNGCKAVFTGKTEEEVLNQVAAHTRVAHGMVDVPPDVVAKVKAALHDR